MICQNCFNVIPDDSAFCGFCGQAVPAPTPIVPEPMPVEPVVAYAEPVAPVVPEPSFEEPVTVVAEPVVSEQAPVNAVPPAVTSFDQPQEFQQDAPPVQDIPAPQPVVSAPVAPETATFFRDEKQERRMGAWGYIWTDIVLFIPIVNIIMFFIWCFSSGTNKARQSYVRSRFIWFVFSLILLAAEVVYLVFINPALINSINALYANILQNIQSMPL